MIQKPGNTHPRGRPSFRPNKQEVSNLRNRIISLTLVTLLVALGATAGLAAPVEINYWGIWGGDPYPAIEGDVIDAFNNRLSAPSHSEVKLF